MRARTELTGKLNDFLKEKKTTRHAPMQPIAPIAGWEKLAQQGQATQRFWSRWGTETASNIRGLLCEDADRRKWPGSERDGKPLSALKGKKKINLGLWILIYVYSLL